MPQKRTASKAKLETKRRASGGDHLLATLDEYRTVLKAAGQTFAVHLLTDDSSHLGAADKWLRAMALTPNTAASCVLALAQDYATNASIIARLVAHFSWIWDCVVDNIPFAIQLYTTRAGIAGELESLFLSITNSKVPSCQHPETGDSLLHYAVEQMHVNVVRHFLITLRCELVKNRAGRHALAAPLVMATVEAEPMEKIIRLFHHARQLTPTLYNPNEMIDDTTILGMLAKYPYPALTRAWLQSYDCDGHVSWYTTIYERPKSPFVEFMDQDGYAILLQCIRDNNRNRVVQLLENGLCFSPLCDDDDHIQSLLTVACDCTSIDIPRLLIQYGANCNRGCTCGAAGILPLSYAIYRKRVDMYELFMGAGGDVRTPENIFAPIVAMICEPMFHERCIQLIPTLAYDAKYFRLHCGDNATLTSLTAICVESGNLELVRAAISHSDKDLYPDESAIVAIEIDNAPILELLLNNARPVASECFQRAALSSNGKLFKMLFAHMQNDPDYARKIMAEPRGPWECQHCMVYMPDLKETIANYIKQWIK